MFWDLLPNRCVSIVKMLQFARRGLPLLINSCRRAFERRAELDACHAAGLFGSLSYWNAAAQFARLQLPRHAHVDLREFLDGAAFAGTQQQLAANSRAFARSALASAKSANESGDDEELQDGNEALRALLEDVDEAASAAAAEQLEAICSPHLFYGVSEARRRALLENHLLVEIQELKVDQIAVAGIHYSQLTDALYEDLIHGRRALTAPSSRDATIEHLAIQVSAETTEVHKMTLVGQEVALVEQQNRRVWVFETRVTDPEALDWRILAEHGANNSARELKPREYLSGGNPEDPSS